jgi:hypothetical protein
VYVSGGMTLALKDMKVVEDLLKCSELVVARCSDP